MPAAKVFTLIPIDFYFQPKYKRWNAFAQHTNTVGLVLNLQTQDWLIACER
jgi:hypothetical protein